MMMILRMIVVFVGGIVGVIVGVILQDVISPSSDPPAIVIVSLWLGCGVAWKIMKNLEARRMAERQANEQRAAEQARSDHDARRKVEKEAERDRSIANLIEESISLLERVPSHLASADKHLDHAENEFKERAFAPFWDAIERAIRNIGSAKEVIETISRHSRSYEALARESQNPILHFPITPSSLQSVAVIQTIATRLRSVVRNAQSDFQFSTIYEQRKTNAILVAGFQSLSDAVNGIGGQIIDTITALGGTINELSSVLDSRLASIDGHTQDAASSATKSIGNLHGSVVEIGSELQRRHDHALEMLDNIQRRRKPDGTRVKDFWTKPV